MKVVYSDKYDLNLGNHVFPSSKYRLIKERLLQENVIEAEDIILIKKILCPVMAVGGYGQIVDLLEG